MNADSAPRWPPTLRPSHRLGVWVHQKEMAATVRIHDCHLLLLSPRADTYLPSHGGWKAESTYALQSALFVQPVPKAVYRSGCRDKHNCPQWDSNLSPLTPKSGMLPLGHCNTADKCKQIVRQLEEHFQQLPFFIWLPANFCTHIIVVGSTIAWQVCNALCLVYK